MLKHIPAQCACVLALTLACTLYISTAAAEPPPNIVIIFADDLGWGDLGAYGNPELNTPHLDRMAAEGQRWTNFYVAAPVCSPSRGALLTGRLPIRTGLFGYKRQVLFPENIGGMPAKEWTLPEALRENGYATGMVGKWHLGDHSPFLPTEHGFDTWFGIPYSNDMMRELPQGITRDESFANPKSEYWNVPVFRDTKIIEQPADQTTITKRYGEEAAKYIRANKDKPFFLYVAHTMPHVPLFRSGDFEGHSRGDIYGDVIEEIDSTVGLILDTIRQAGIAENTLVIFSSDNGPWRSFLHQGGSAGPLKQGKNTTWEGGMRVPGIFWWPGSITPGIQRGMGSTLDLLPTCLALAGGQLRTDRTYDGFDLSNVLLKNEPSPRQEMFYYRRGELHAYRYKQHKIHFITHGSYGMPPDREIHDIPILHHLGRDPGEQWEIQNTYPEIVADLVQRTKNHLNSFKPAESIFDLNPPR